jgi:hypothetical protein
VQFLAAELHSTAHSYPFYDPKVAANRISSNPETPFAAHYQAQFEASKYLLSAFEAAEPFLLISSAL